jgi:cystathionine beta-lyase
MTFDRIIDRRGTHSSKWDTMEQIYGVSPKDGLAMWVADMDFRSPACVDRALAEYTAQGVYGYFADFTAYHDAIRWWMKERHGWAVEAGDILTTHGLVNGTGMCVDAFTKPGDGVVLFTPVYHAFARVIRAAGRQVVECPLVNDNGRYTMDFASYDAAMTGAERMVILCSPHNPGGRVWTQDELRGVADFARRHDLILVSDEIHHDLLFPGQHHIPMTVAAPDVLDRLVMMTATSKTFNLAGAHTGNVIIPDPGLRKIFAARMAALGIAPNAFGVVMATAAYSPEGAAWVDDLMRYLAGNRQLFDDAINALPGIASMRLEATYLAWVDFSGTGMTPKEIATRITRTARIAANLGPTFGTGGESFMRFNIAMPRAQVIDAVHRLQSAFADLQ